MFLHITIDFFANLALALTSVALTTRLRSLRDAKRIVGAQISGKRGNLGKMWADGGFAEAITTSKEPHLSKPFITYRSIYPSHIRAKCLLKKKEK